MKYRLIVQDEAVDAIDRIANYVVDRFGLPLAALRKVELIWRKIDLLAENPYIGYRLLDDPWYQLDFRVLSCDNYRIVYVPNKEKRTVNIITVLHTLQDLQLQLSRLRNDN